jgi:transportin-1
MRMFPLLECLSSVLSAVGLEAQQYVLGVYTRCLRIAGTVISAHQQAAATVAAAAAGAGQASSPLQGDADGVGHDLPSKDFAICALDVISALCEGLDDLFATLVRDGNNTRDALFQLMFTALQDSLPELRQSGFSLAGEISKHSIALVTPELAAQLVQYCVQCLDTEHPLVCNNAAWAVGELALRVGGDFLQPHIAHLMSGLITGEFSISFYDVSCR